MSAARGAHAHRSAIWIGFTAVMLLLATAGPAAAHSVLLGTSPAESSQVATPPASVTLTFNEMPRAEYSTIHVFGPDGGRRDSGPVHVLNDTVTEQLGGTRPAGTYTVDWRVTSADGHPVSGQFTFRAASDGTALAPRAPAPTPNAAGGSGSNFAVVIGVIVFLVILLGGLAYGLRRRRGTRAPHEKEVDGAY